jgi:predicted adenine nucleotide alpha hydrolase (AANH) superfamily ATPase
MNKDFNEIDKLAKDAFENYEVDFNPEDWNKMEQKLNKKEHLMPYIWLYKGTEAFIFLLIIFT